MEITKVQLAIQLFFQEANERGSLNSSESLKILFYPFLDFVHETSEQNPERVFMSMSRIVKDYKSMVFEKVYPSGGDESAYLCPCCVNQFFESIPLADDFDPHHDIWDIFYRILEETSKHLYSENIFETYSEMIYGYI